MKSTLIRIFRHYRMFLKKMVNKVVAGLRKPASYECE